MSTNVKNTGYSEGLIAGLAPALGLPKIGEVYKDTTQQLAVKINEEIAGTFNLPELDNIIFTPRVARNNVGLTELIATAYFSTQNSSGNIFYKGKGNPRTEGGRINMVNTAGIAAGGTGPFGTSEHFRQIIKPLCKVNDNGKPIMNIKTVPGTNNLASIDLDPNALLSIALGIKANDPYDFDIMSVMPIPNTNNFVIAIMKYISSDGVKKGRNSQVNYARIEQEQYRRYNGGGSNNNRSY